MKNISTKRNDLKDFLDLLPSALSVNQKQIIISDILEFHDITKMFAFCYLCNSVGYSVLFNRQQLEIKDEDEIVKLKAISYFVLDGKDTCEPILRSETE